MTVKQICIIIIIIDSAPSCYVDICSIKVDEVSIALADHLHAGGSVAAIQAVQLWLQVLGLEGQQHGLTLELLCLRDDTPTNGVGWAMVHVVQHLVKVISCSIDLSVRVRVTARRDLGG